MKKLSLLTLLFAALLATYCGPSEPEPSDASPETPQTQAAPLKAMAELAPTQDNEASGTVTFEQQPDGGVHISANISGLPAGKHGFHIHETGDCSAPDATSAGGHFNPEGTAHGAPDSAEHHAGDLGNLEADEDGNAELHVTYNFITLGEGANSIVGKAVIVHAGEDDFVTQPTGAAGARLACGVIQEQ